MSFFHTSDPAFGLDISDKTIRLIQLKKFGNKYSIKSYNEINLPNNCLVLGEIKQPAVFIEHVHKLIKTRHGRGSIGSEVITVLPEEKAFLKTLELPVSETPLLDQIKEVLPQYLPFEIDDIYMDYQVTEKNAFKQKCLMGATPKAIVDSYIQVLNQIKLIPVIVEIEAAAIARCLIEHSNNKEPQIVIDFGATRTGLFLYDGDNIQFSVSLPISGNKITELISNALELDVETAEKAKIICGLDKNKCDGAILEIFAEALEELHLQIKKAIGFYEANFPGSKPISKIILSGGGANFSGISEILSQKIGITVQLSNPWQNIQNPNPAYFTPQKSQSYITAIGLALRGLKQEEL